MTPNISQLYIDGRWVDSESDVVLDVRNPATEKVIGRVPQATVAEVTRAIDAARRAFDEGPWPTTAPRERARTMLRMADAMDKRRAELIGRASCRERVWIPV